MLDALMNFLLDHRLQILGSAYVVWSMLATAVTVLFMGQTWSRWNSTTLNTSQDGVLLLMLGVTMVATGGAVTRAFMASASLSTGSANLLIALLGENWVFLLLSAVAVVMGYSLHLHSALRGTRFEMHPLRLLGGVGLSWLVVLAVIL